MKIFMFAVFVVLSATFGWYTYKTARENRLLKALFIFSLAMLICEVIALVLL